MKRLFSVLLVALITGCADTPRPTETPRLAAAGAPSSTKGGHPVDPCVSIPQTIKAVALAPSAATVAVGASNALTARNQDGVVIPPCMLAWSSSNTGLAIVDDDGVVHGVAVGGPVTIRVETKDKKPLFATATVTIVPPPSIGSFAVTASELTVAQATQLSWSTTNATSCTIDNGVGAVPCSGSMIVTPGSSKTYTLSASGGGASVTATTSVSVGRPGRFVYTTASGDSKVYMYSINALSGDLTSIGTTTVEFSQPMAIAVDPLGRFVYAADFAYDKVYMYTVDRTTGVLTANGSIATGRQPRAIFVDPTGRYAYVTNANVAGPNGSVSMYRISESGQLIAIGTVAVGAQPIPTSTDALGRFLFVVNGGSNTVSMFSINNDGTLSSLGTVATGSAPDGLTADPSGRFMYVSNYSDNTISQFSIGSGGILTPLATVPSAGGPDGIGVDATGRYLYACIPNAPLIRSYAINQSTGALTDIGATSPGARFPDVISSDLQGRFMYAVGGNTWEVMTFQITSTGVLAPSYTINAGHAPGGIAVSR